MKTGISNAVTPTSRTSRKKMVARNCCWLRRTSPKRASALMEIFFAASCDCHDFWKSSRFMTGSFQSLGELFANSVQLHAHVALRDAQDFAHLAITQPIEVHQR